MTEQLVGDDPAAEYSTLTAADQQRTLGADELRRLGICAHLLCLDDEACTALGRASRAFLDAGEVTEAGRCAFWAGMTRLLHGQYAEASGWFARASRHQPGEATSETGVVAGYLLIPAALQALYGGEPHIALTGFSAAVETGERYGERDLLTLGLLGRGQSLVRQGLSDEGVTALDEAMLAVTAGEVSPIPTGIVYCAVIGLCQLRFDVGRASEWTAALDRWCAARPHMVAFRGECRMFRSQLLQHAGDWTAAVAEAELAVRQLSDPPGQPALGSAYYQLAELRRLRADTAAAQEAYRLAHGYGRDPQPGLALLHLAQGDADTAAAALRRALEETTHHLERCHLLPAAVEVFLRVGDVDAAAAAVRELDDHTVADSPPWLVALDARARGALLLGRGEGVAAAAELRRAVAVWLDAGAPYEAARSRVLLALARRAAGDDEAAELDLAAARAVFDGLGAVPDVDQVDRLRHARPRAAGGLTAREVEVLRLVAGGRTNRAVATELFLSEKTVARHLSNIFTKLDLSSRAAATAYAYEHHLL